MLTSELNVPIGPLIIMIAIISFLGFLLENAWLAVRKGYIDNRNMHAPFLVGYGLAVTDLYALLGSPSDPKIFDRGVHRPSGEYEQFAVYFLIVFFCVSAGEIMLGYFIEKFCGVILWDYTALPLHFTRYTSVFTSIGFSLIIMYFLDNAFEPLMGRLMKLDSDRTFAAGIILAAIMVADLVHWACYMKKNGKQMIRWKLDLRSRTFEKYML